MTMVTVAARLITRLRQTPSRPWRDREPHEVEHQAYSRW